MPSGIWTAVLGLIALTVAGSPRVLAADEIPADALEKIRAAVPAKALATPAKPRRLLVYTDCKGFKHSSVPYCAAALRIMGEKTGAFAAEVSDNPDVFKPENLARFDAVCFDNTTGELFTDAALKESLLAYVRDGHGLVGIHAATDCFYEWPEFGALLGGYFDGHPWHEEVGVKVDEPRHPLNAMFTQPTFRIADEIYQFRDPYARTQLRVLLSLDTSATDMHKPGIKRTDGDFAISWIRTYGLGRVFYCSFGHDHEIFWNPGVLAHDLAGIQYALGDLPADATPSAQSEPDGWERLFNGHDLTGWIAKPGSWKVEDGTLTRAGGGDIFTSQAFSDFVLELEFKIAAQTNSGVFFRVGDIRDCVQTGLEIQVLDSHGKPAPDLHDCGAVYDCLAPTANAARPAGEWNQLRLSCQGPHIQVRLNGQDIVDLDADQWTTPGKNPDGSANKFKTAVKDFPRTGRLGLQDHGHPVWYRNIRIQPVNP